MKEKFRNKIPAGKIKIRYKISGVLNFWETTAEELFSQIDEVVDYYISVGIKLTNRQLYYQLVGKDLIPNADEVYKKVCVFLTDVRYAGLIDWEAIEDKEREPHRKGEWNSIKSIVQSAINVYRLPRWDDQEYYLEMYCEKKAGINVLQPIADNYHIYFGFNKGYSSASAMYDLAKRIMEQIENSKMVIILYFGDHDASGLDMIRDINERITEFLVEGEYPVEPDFEVIPVALTMKQIEEYNPPPNPAKITDPRAKWYIEKFGEESWELDSIDAMELRRIAENSILRYIDIEKYNTWVKREKREKKLLIKFADELK